MSSTKTLSKPCRRQTRIVTTLGPAVNTYDMLHKLLSSGVNAVRLNFSHGSHADHSQLADWTRKISSEIGRDIAIIADLQGPKIRIGDFVAGHITLKPGAEFKLSPSWPLDAGTSEGVGTDYQPLAEQVAEGDQLLLDDGLIELMVVGVSDNTVTTQVVAGGQLSSRKGLNKRGGGLSANAITKQDKLDIQCAAKLGADYVAFSFVQSAADIEYGRNLLKSAHSSAHVIAKIERHEAVENLDGILQATDAVMVARGDLCVEIGNAALPGVQKRILRQAREHNRPCIVATQMLESMTHCPQPTRAEIMDVANAVLDGTDAVMLSGETAVGEYPVETVVTMAKICRGVEADMPINSLRNRSREHLDEHFSQPDEAIAMAAVYTARHARAKAIIALTETGNTALWMSRLTSGIPIYALTPHEKTRQRVALYRGVYAVKFSLEPFGPLKAAIPAIEHLLEQGVIERGQRVLLTKGDGSEAGGTNTMKLIDV